MTWWGRLIKRPTVERQLDAELRDHFDRLVADYRQAGWTEIDARRRARLEFGGLDQVKELCRDARGTRWLEEFVQDVRYGVRGFRKAPTFTAVAVATLALGVAATMTIFNLVDALLLRPLPVANADELVTLVRLQAGTTSDHFSYPQVRELSARTDLFASLAGMGSDALNVGPPEALEPTGTAWVNGGYFVTLGLVPAAGRLLSAADDLPGASPAAVISHDYWTRRFGADAAVVGTQLRIEGVQVPIVGIAPRGFTGATVGERADLTLAIASRAALQPENAGFLDASSRWLRLLGRPPRGLSAEQLQAALDTTWPQILRATLPSSLNAASRARALTMTVSVQPGAQGTSQLRARFRRPLAIALALVALVLVIACVNVANLLLARAATRAKEIALRLAVGAGRNRIIRQLLTESALLALGGTAIGVTLGAVGSLELIALIASAESGPEGTAIGLDVAINWRVAAAASALMLATTVLFGLMPAYRASCTAPQAATLSATRVAESHGRVSATLIVAQVALSLALVTAAGLFARSLHHLRGLDRGFRIDNILLVDFDPRRAQLSSADLRAFNRNVLEAVAGLPGMQAASLAAVTPLQGGGLSAPVFLDGRATDEEVYYNVVAPRYFEIMHTRVRSGRDFTPADDASAPAVAVVNEAFARRYLRSSDGLGQRVAFTEGTSGMAVIGVVADAVYETLREEAPPTVYLSYLQQRGRSMTLVLDPIVSIAEAAAAVRADVQPKVPAQPLRVRTLATQVDGSLIRERIMALLAGIVGTLALALAAVGLFGLVSYSVINRTREFGVRLALGASPGRIEHLVLRNALWLAAMGIVSGLPLAWLLSGLVRSSVFGVAPSDPVTLVTAVTALTMVSLLAALGPARRAARIDPALSLRGE